MYEVVSGIAMTTTSVAQRTPPDKVDRTCLRVMRTTRMVVPSGTDTRGRPMAPLRAGGHAPETIK